MKIYERYLAKQIYLTFTFVLFAFVGLFFFFDLINELNTVGHGNYKFSYAVVRVLLLTPSRFYEIIPVAALISAIYVFATMASNSEYTIFRVSGLSTGRALMTLIKIAVPMVIVTFIFGEVIGPYSDQLSERIRLEALGSAVSSNFRSGVWVKDTVAPNASGQAVTRFVNVQKLNPNSTIEGVRIYEFDSQFRLEDVRTAQRGEFIAPDHWRLFDVSDTHIVRLTEDTFSPANALVPVYKSVLSQDKEFLMRSRLTPEILSVLLVTPDHMSIYNLFSYIQHLQQNEQDAQRYLIALWHKCLYPFAVFVMLILSLPFAYLHTRSGAVSVKVFGGIMLGMSFQLSNTLFSHVGTLDTWPAPITAAAPGLIYLVLGLFALRWVERR
jgi:lipopolysaccharide export system permease protein